MKKLLVVVAVLAAAPAAMASKARVESLNNSRSLVDFQTAFDRPYQFMALGDQATIEWGTNSTTTDANPHAEGGFLRHHGDSAFGAYFGRRSDDFSQVITFVKASPAAGVANLMYEQNGLNLFYAGKMGDWTYGATLKYSNGKNDVNGAKVSSSGLALAATNGTWNAELIQGLTGKSEATGVEVESKGLTKLTVGYNLEADMEVYGRYNMVKVEGGGSLAGQEIERTGFGVGMWNVLSRTDDGVFFYGAELNSSKTKDDEESMNLPVYLGVEANAASWLVLRASVAQNVILNETKDITPGATGDKTDLDSTVVAAGAGFKFGKSLLDVSFKGASTNGEFNTNTEMFSQVGYTYTF